ncbi:molybdate ABC transporter, periplasmic molybdate-binding protein [marine gamma proteobacterium HTCC2080]|nr:molybdate ABC transporter, periplasmic molybdate-binding protein [marine gamma proteobacterium HTCC2080]
MASLIIRWAGRLALLVSCLHGVATYAEQSLEKPLVVAVAANFAGAAEQLAADFTNKTGVPIRLVIGSTGLLYAQITQGAPVDLFLAADTDRPLALVTQNFGVDQSYAVYTRGRIVLWVPGAEDVPDPEAFLTVVDSVALANPLLAPYGRAASEVMARFPGQSAGLRVVRGQNIGSTFTQIASGAVPGGFVALSQVLAKDISRQHYRVIPEEWHQPIEQALVVVNNQDMHPAAQSFRDFLLSKKASVMLGALGYVVEGG